MRQATLPLLMAIFLNSPLVVAAPCAGFTDVLDSAVYCTGVTYLKNKSITVGCGATTYCPNDFVTRAQMALFLQRMGRGGTNNIIGDYKSTIGGGDSNTSNAVYTTVGGGYKNKASISYASVGGGSTNSATGTVSTIAGGYNNTASGGYSFIGAGSSNLVAGVYGTIAGGAGNNSQGNWAVIGGGQDNVTSAPYATIAGGHQNHAAAATATVAGGEENVASGEDSTVAGGFNNVASGDRAFVAGGQHNDASGTSSTVAGGAYNSAIGTVSMVPGGFGNAAEGYGSFAAGYGAYAKADGCFVFGDASDSAAVTCAYDNGFVVRATGGAYFLTSGNSDATYHGAVLYPGSGAWSIYSDRDGKDRIVPVDALEVLARVVAMPVVTWHYKPQDNSITHMGPVAQDFFAAFGLGENDKSINSVDGQGVALAAIQGLNAKLEAENTELRARLTRIEAVLARQ